MEKVFLEDGILKGATKMNSCFHLESDLYRKEDKLIKLLHSKYRTSSREDTINLLSEYHNDSCITPNQIIYSKGETISPGFVGFTSLFLDKPFKTLDIFINNPNIPFKTRLDVAKKLSMLMESFEREKFVYYDLHSENIMCDNENIKVIDMDSVLYKALTDSLTYRVNLNAECYRLCSLVLSIIYGIDSDDFGELIAKNKSLFNRTSNEQTKKVFDGSIDNQGRVFYPTDYIDSFDEDTVMNTKMKLERII